MPLEYALGGHPLSMDEVPHIGLDRVATQVEDRVDLEVEALHPSCLLHVEAQHVAIVHHVPSAWVGGEV